MTNLATGSVLLALFGALWTARLWKRGKRRHAALVALLAALNAVAAMGLRISAGAGT